MKRLLSIAAVAALALPACVTMPASPNNFAQQQQPGVDYCPQRLPVARQRLEQMYTRTSQIHRQDSISASVVGPDGKAISVSVGSSNTGTIVMSEVATGLSDMVFNCGDDFTGHDCFIDVYLDGRKMLSMGPNTSGVVGMRCLLAGQRQLRIESVGRVIYDGMIDLKSDHEYRVQVRKKRIGAQGRFKVYAVNHLADRVPPIPTKHNTTTVTTGGALAVGVGSGGTTVGATATSGDAQAPVVDVRSSAKTTAHTTDHSTTSSTHDRGTTHTTDRGRTTSRGHYHGPGGTTTTHHNTDHRSHDRGSTSTSHTTTTSNTSDNSSSVRIGPAPVKTTVTTTTTTGPAPGPAPGPATETVEVHHHHHHGPAPVRAMSRGQYRKLRAAIKKESFKNGKLAVLRMAMKHHHLTCAQAKGLLGLYSFETSKVDAAVMMHPRLVDQQNFYTVMSAFTFSSSKKKVRQQLGL